VAVRLDAHQPGLGAFFGGDRMSDPIEIETAMGARADARVFLAAPVNQIMFAFGAGPGVIGNLVRRQSVSGADLLRDIIQRARGRLVRRFQFARGMQAEERRLRLDRELIERQMLGGFRDREVQLIRPHLRRLAGAGINQVERITIKGGAGDRDRVERLARGVQTSQRFQRGVVQRLHAERNPVDAGGAIAAKPRRLDAGRIGFEGDFRVGRHAPVLADRIQDRADGLRPHQ